MRSSARRSRRRTLFPPRLSTPEEFLKAEEERRRFAARVADLLTARSLVAMHLDPGFVGPVVRRAVESYRDAGCRRVKQEGWRPTSILLPGGKRLSVWTPYVRPTRKGLVGRPRGDGKRRAGGAGCYPVLAALGITDGVTPLTRSEICRQTVLCSSYAEAEDQLARGGLAVDTDTLVRVAVATGNAAITARDDAVRAAREGAPPVASPSPLRGKRVRVSLDGGRVRTRHTNRRARKGNNGRRPFELLWKEPRVITIDVLGDDGEMDHDFPPIYEVAMGDADEVYALLTGLLRLLGLKEAAEIVFVADGAEWIWNRVARLIEDAELPAQRVHLVLDYYHATEHIEDALQVCRNLNAKKRAALFVALRRLLLEPGGAQKVIERLRPFARGRRGRKVNKEIAYLDGHLAHMDYAGLAALKLPMGSGVVESAIRRVLNLRFKGASICWRPDHVEPLMYLRAALKAGRWDDFIRAHLAARYYLAPPPARPQLDHLAAAA